ncbi:hypothetical protein KM043_001827 [Ampulex compressa]|nr:hypothetical protein KM043_001827 [Ampulex compressa]
MVKTKPESNVSLSTKGLPQKVKHGYVAKKKSQKFKKTPMGKILLINDSGTQNDNNHKSQKNGQKNSNSSKKSPNNRKTYTDEKKNHDEQESLEEESTNKRLKRKTASEESNESDDDTNEGTALQEKTHDQKESLKEESTNKRSKKKTESEESDESDEDINEGIVLQEEISMAEEEQDQEEEDDEDSDVPDILGATLNDDSDEDDEDFGEDEEESEEVSKGNVARNKGINMFKGVKTMSNDNDESIENDEGTDDDDEEIIEEEHKDESNLNLNSSNEVTDNIDSDDSDEDDEEYDQEHNIEEESGSLEEEEEDDEDEDSEDEDSEDDEGEDSGSELKALLGNSIADDEDSSYFAESGEDDEDEDITDDEEDEYDEEIEDEHNKDTLHHDKESDAVVKGPKYTKEELMELDKHTIYIGNLPRHVKMSTLKQHFAKFGPIKTIRFRGIIPERANMPKKVAAITKKIHPEINSLCAFIIYKLIESVELALSMNGKLFEGNYLRVDCANKSQHQPDPKKCVFLGNLPYKIDDNVVWEHFKDCGEIDYVRVIRDGKTGIGKGFAYINFKTEDAVSLALELNETKLLNRAVRVKPYSSNNKDKNKHQNRNKRLHAKGDEVHVSNKKLKNNVEDATVPTTYNRVNATKRKERQFKKTKNGAGNDAGSPQQSSTKFQGQKADMKKKKKGSKMDKKRKIMAAKLTSKPKKLKTNAN